MGINTRPLLFVTYMNDIPTVTFNLVLYTDETAIIIPLSVFIHCSQRDVSTMINLELSKLSDWLAVNKLTLNASETKFMLFHNYQKSINTLRPRQNGRHFTDDTFKHIFLNDNVWISLKISLKFVPRVRINNIPALVQIMAWRRPGDKPLSNPMMVSLLTHICVTRPQWVNEDDIPHRTINNTVIERVTEFVFGSQ